MATPSPRPPTRSPWPSGPTPAAPWPAPSTPRTPPAGTSSFAGCKITGKAGSYTLTATASGLTGATSSAFNVTAGTATQLVFTTQPGGGANGSAWSTQPAVSVEDASGNTVTTATNSITLALGTNPGGALACTTNPLGATGGTSSFAGCKITGKAGSYTLTATATDSPGHQSCIHHHSGHRHPARLQHPAQRRGGWRHLGHPTRRQHRGRLGQRRDHRRQLDHLGHRDQPGGRWPAPPTRSAPPAASPTFAGCEITGKLGSYTLTASATGLTSAASNNIPITIGAASQLNFTTEPGGGVNGQAWATQPVVTVQDAGSNTVPTATNSITLAITTQPGTGATIGCTANPKTAAAGVATFAGCEITGQTGSYTVSASARLA